MSYLSNGSIFGEIFKEMNEASRNTIDRLNEVYDKFPFPAPTYFLIYGSLSRYEFLPNSDLDLIVLSDDVASSIYQKQINDALSNIPCGKTDIKFLTPNDVVSIANSSMIEGEYIRSAKVINNKGNNKLQNIRKSLEKVFTRNWLEQNFTFKYFFLEKYVYPSKSNEMSPSLKYSSGASRDALFLDWFLEFDTEYQNNTFLPISLHFPIVETVLKDIRFCNLLSPSQIEKIRMSVPFLFWIKEKSLLLNRNTDKQGRAFLDDVLAKKLIDTFPRLRLMNINTPQELKVFFLTQRRQLSHTKKIMFLHLLQSWSKSRDNVWLTIALELLNSNFTNYKVALSDDLLRIILIWMSHDYPVFFEKIISEITSHNWITLVSLCASPNCPSDFLDYVAKNFTSVSGYEHISKLIITNPNSSAFALKLAASSEKTPQKYKTLAEERIKYPGLSTYHFQKHLWGKA